MERLILRQPPDRFRRDDVGQRIDTPCEGGATTGCVIVDSASSPDFTERNPRNYTDWEVYARRTDRGGREGLFADTTAGSWNTRFDFPRFAALDGLNEDWGLVDVDGRIWDIEAVAAAPQSGGRMYWKVFAIRRQAGSG